MWQKINDYYLQQGNWTICKTGKEKVIYGLWHGAECKGWFMSADEAKKVYEELNR